MSATLLVASWLTSCDDNSIDMSYEIIASIASPQFIPINAFRRCQFPLRLITVNTNAIRNVLICCFLITNWLEFSLLFRWSELNNRSRSELNIYYAMKFVHNNLVLNCSSSGQEFESRRNWCYFFIRIWIYVVTITFHWTSFCESRLGYGVQRRQTWLMYGIWILLYFVRFPMDYILRYRYVRRQSSKREEWIVHAKNAH